MHKLTTTLLQQAAQMRSLGMTWEAIGLQLNRKGKSCQQWTMRYADLWQNLYHHAQQNQNPNLHFDRNRSSVIDQKSKSTVKPESNPISVGQNRDKTPSKSDSVSQPHTFKMLGIDLPKKMELWERFWQIFTLILSICRTFTKRRTTLKTVQAAPQNRLNHLQNQRKEFTEGTNCMSSHEQRTTPDTDTKSGPSPASRSIDREALRDHRLV